jgi:hypothetical protein
VGLLVAAWRNYRQALLLLTCMLGINNGKIMEK